MTVQEILRRCSSIGVTLRAAGKHLRWKAPVGAVDGELQSLIRSKKRELLCELRGLKDRETLGLLMSQVGGASCWDELGGLCEEIDQARPSDRLTDAEVDELCDAVRERAGVVPETLSANAEEDPHG